MSTLNDDKGYEGLASPFRLVSHTYGKNEHGIVKGEGAVVCYNQLNKTIA